jgi:hypothetical protein
LLVVLESTIQLVTNVGESSSIELKELVGNYRSYSPNHDVQDSGCYGRAHGRARGARGGMNEGPTATLESY